MYQKLLDLVDQRERAESTFAQKKKKFEDENSVLTAQIQDLKEKETLARDEALLRLEKDNVPSVEVGDKVIYRQSRVTKSIADAEKLHDSFLGKCDELYEIGVKSEEMDLFDQETVVTDKAMALKVAEKYFKVTGKELEGIGVKVTNFVAVKDKTTNE